MLSQVLTLYTTPVIYIFFDRLAHRFSVAWRQRGKPGGRSGGVAMNLSAPFIHRPVATTLLTVAIALAGAVAFRSCRFRRFRRSIFRRFRWERACRERARKSWLRPSPRRWSGNSAASPASREMTSSSFLGTTSITLQFDLNRDINGAARDVQAAINAARSYLPANLPSNPTYRKVNPADAPIMILALTSNVYDRGACTTLPRRSCSRGFRRFRVWDRWASAAARCRRCASRSIPTQLKATGLVFRM